MLRCNQKSIIFLINNGGYTIEVEIHDGPYNVIKNWNYTALVDAIHNNKGKSWTTEHSGCHQSPNLKQLLWQVRTEADLEEAVATATGEKKERLCFIEIFVHKDYMSSFSRVCFANSRPLNPQ
uniref:pyruvate decarboxylase n=1 Tax=Kalanchoe fedtschenkoi TaxID=63787 RepID=A0A7N0U2F9_KALFE